MKKKQPLGIFTQGQPVHADLNEVMRIRASQVIGQVSAVSAVSDTLDLKLRDGSVAKDLRHADLEDVSEEEKKAFQMGNPYFVE